MCLVSLRALSGLTLWCGCVGGIALGLSYVSFKDMKRVGQESTSTTQSVIPYLPPLQVKTPVAREDGRDARMQQVVPVRTGVLVPCPIHGLVDGWVEDGDLTGP